MSPEVPGHPNDPTPAGAHGGVAPKAGSVWTTLPVIIGAITALVVAVSGLIAALSGALDKFPLFQPSPTPSAPITLAPATPTSAGATPYPPRGALLFEVKMDGPSAVSNVVARDLQTRAFTAAATITQSPTGILLLALRSEVAAKADISPPTQFPLYYVGELELVVSPNSDIDFTWTVRGHAEERSPRYVVQIHSKAQQLDFRFLDESVGRNDLLASVDLKSQSGDRLKLSAVVNDNDLVQLFVNGQYVAKGNAPASSAWPPNIDIHGAGPGGGSVNLLAARFYAIPSAPR